MHIPDILNWYGIRAAELGKEMREKGGIERHQSWRLEYYENPYLLLVSDEELQQRFIDLHANVVELNEDGKIVPHPMISHLDDLIWRNWTQAVEAFNSRGGLQGDLIGKANTEIGKYFRDGEPPGVAMFKGMPRVLKDHIVKFSERKHLEPMLRFGRIRLLPASGYRNGNLLKSMVDLELERLLRVPAIRAALSGQNTVSIRGKMLPIEGGAVSLRIMATDYHLFSTCREMDRRMPTDFRADGALVIKDAKRFTDQFRNAYKKTFGQSDVLGGEVNYFDPFRPPKNMRQPEFFKHFAFSYQKEHRIVARPFLASISPEPIFLEIGSLEEYCEIVPSPR